MLKDFYENVIKSAGYTVDDEGYIRLPEPVKSIVSINDRTLVLPYKNQLDSMTEVVDGKIKVKKIIFNPLNEDVVKGDSESLKKLKVAVDTKLSYATAVVMELLMKLGGSLDLQKKASLDLNTFIGTLSTARKANITKVVDDNTLEKWNKIYTSVVRGAPSKGLIHLALKKGGTIDNVKYNRTASVTYPIYKAILKLEKKPVLNNVKLRPKDVTVYKLIYKYIFDDLGLESNYLIGSNDSTAPGFVVLFKMYSTIATRLNGLLEELKFIDEETAVSGIIDILVKDEELDNLERFSKELAIIPNDLDANRNKAMERVGMTNTEQPTEAKVNSKGSNLQAILNNNMGNTFNRPTRSNIPTKPLDSYKTPTSTITTAREPIVEQRQPIVNEPVVAPVRRQNSTEMTPAQKILYGNTNIPNGSPANIRPGGVDTLINNTRRQPIVQQPQLQPHELNRFNELQAILNSGYQLTQQEVEEYNYYMSILQPPAMQPMQQNNYMGNQGYNAGYRAPVQRVRPLGLGG